MEGTPLPREAGEGVEEHCGGQYHSDANDEFLFAGKIVGHCLCVVVVVVTWA